MIKAELINLGRCDVNKVVDVKNVKSLHKEIGKYILSKNWDMEETETPNLYVVSSGLRSVGHVKILES